MTSRVGPKGQVVIPQQLRVELGIHPGDEVEMWLDGDHVALRPVAEARPLRGRYRGEDLVGDLMAERRSEVERDAAREAAW
ncbi:MAG: AbrB/MazE/SpoVT family DNA-binding domain-containing protein [Pseudonocardia sp.]|nr:AbrB/MazE/SpoVT family DNA-binding domain-containing protein [Pseudonocardia sp.]